MLFNFLKNRIKILKISRDVACLPRWIGFLSNWGNFSTNYIFNRSVIYSFSIIFILKLLYFLKNGIVIETDSYGYLECILNFYFPPYYPYFLYFLRIIYPSFYLVIVAQIILFSLSASIFLKYFINSKKLILISAILIGIDPATSFFCVDIMSECLFITFLFPWFILLHYNIKDKVNSTTRLFLLGVLAGILYSIRFAGIIFMVFPLFLFLFYRLKRKGIFKAILLIFFGFQIIILPIRIKFQYTFDTYRFNGFTGCVLWNNASAIYNYSDIRKNPKTKFEKHLSKQDTNLFTTNNSIFHARQIWSPDFPYRTYMAKYKYKFEDIYKVSPELTATALKIIFEKPGLYIKKCVIPNFLQVFTTDVYQNTEHWSDFVLNTYHFKYSKKKVYNKYKWTFYFILLIISSFIYLFRKSKGLFCTISISLCWCYILILPFINSLATRLYLILTPFILLCLLFQIHKIITGKLTIK